MDIKGPVNLAMEEKSAGIAQNARINIDHLTGKV